MKQSAQCHDEQRRSKLRHQRALPRNNRSSNTSEQTGDTGTSRFLNGLDSIEVRQDAITKKIYLQLHFINRAPEKLSRANIRIEGGRRIRDINIVGEPQRKASGNSHEDDFFEIQVNHAGDFSPYQLRLVKPDAYNRPGEEILDGFDPLYAEVEFVFHPDCPQNSDDLPTETCAQEPAIEPAINYLAKDYASFRQLILDRLSLTMPNWNERHVPDLGVTLVELLAYTADYLSYYQDAVATEAYLGTARRRISVRRHARLIDYHMHEGCNARAWVHLHVNHSITLSPKDIYFTTTPTCLDETADKPLVDEHVRQHSNSSYEVFEPVIRQGDMVLWPAHNAISFYTWGNQECCLPRGATEATLSDQLVQDDTHTSSSRYLHLQPGDVLLFEEVISPQTGARADADLHRRHVVRLTEVEEEVDPLDNQPIVHIAWGEADALPFALCLSAIGRAPECALIENVSVARGNMILVDHGRSVEEDSDAQIPALLVEDMGCAAEGKPVPSASPASVYKWRLEQPHVTHRVPFPAPATIARCQSAILRDLVQRVDTLTRKEWRRVSLGQPISAEVIDHLRKMLLGKVTTRDDTNQVPGAGHLNSAAGLDHLHQGEPGVAATPRAAKVLDELDRLAHRAMTTSHRARQIAQLFPLLERLQTLAARAEAGQVLGEADIAEITQIVGPTIARHLKSDNPALFGPANEALLQTPQDAVPAIVLEEIVANAGVAQLTPYVDLHVGHVHVPQPQNATSQWECRCDLLASGPQDRHVVVEVDDEGYSWLRFGDGRFGRMPVPCATLRPRYRVGNGAAGNVGAEAITQIVFKTIAPTTIWTDISVRNPLPATGGVDLESIVEVRQRAPTAFRKTLQRAITSDDYARLAERHPGVQRAAAILRWTGGWYEVQIAIDRLGSEEVDQQLIDEVASIVAPYRRMGHDVVVVPARSVPLEIALEICVLPHYQRGQIMRALLDLFSQRVLANGQRGLFHPDTLTFGKSIFLSQLVAAATAVEGVESAAVTKLQRLFAGDQGEIQRGVLPIGPLEIACVDNDPNFPERGVFRLTLRGGR